jgi:hypothetical protein
MMDKEMKGGVGPKEHVKSLQNPERQLKIFLEGYNEPIQLFHLGIVHLGLELSTYDLRAQLPLAFSVV